ncbi:MAG: MFS transporter, partial [Mailhella sp.]|nr:MFS transporter [Mailhella sp.]
MVPLIVGQLLFLAVLTPNITALYQDLTYKTGHQITRQVSWDLERIVGLGMPISKIKAMDDWLTERKKHIDALGIVVYDEHGQIHCAIGNEGAIDYEKWQKLRNHAILAHREVHHPVSSGVVGSVFVAMDPEKSMSNVLGVMLDNLTLTIVTALFLSELIFLLVMSSGGLAVMAASSDFMRPIIFACLFGTEMSMSYVPIRIGELGLDLFGLPPDVVSGLPVSSELFMAGAAMLVGGFWSQRSGWRPMLFSGLLLSFGGAILSWMATSPLPFILARGFSGLGYGFINLSAQVFVIAHSSASSRARNLAFMFAGLYAGTLCGSALGGLIADRLGYQAVFPATAILLILLVVSLWQILPRESWQREQSSERLTFKETLEFFKDRRMGVLLLFFIIPNALITVCLFQFFVPLSLSQAGTSPASIGRVFLVY